MSKATKALRKARRDKYRDSWNDTDMQLVHGAADALRAGDKTVAYELMAARVSLAGYEHGIWAAERLQSQKFMATEAERAEWRLDQWNGGRQDRYQSGDQGDPFGMGFRGWLGWETPDSIKIESAAADLAEAQTTPADKPAAAARRAERIATMRGQLAMFRQRQARLLAKKLAKRQVPIAPADSAAAVAGIKLPHDPNAGKLMKLWSDLPDWERELLTEYGQQLRDLPMPPLVDTRPEAEPLDRPNRNAFVVGPDYIPGNAFEPYEEDSPKRRTLRVIDGKVRLVANRYRGGAAGLAYHEKYAARELSPSERATVARIKAGQ